MTYGELVPENCLVMDLVSPESKEQISLQHRIIIDLWHLDLLWALQVAWNYEDTSIITIL